jgi:GT2 family glycosyltransferase
MPEAIVITPVKDSINTTLRTIEAITKNKADFEYYVFNDFSTEENTRELEKAKIRFGFNLINLSDHTNTPSPNYKLVLEMAQKKALSCNCPLLIIESDVVIKNDTIDGLLGILRMKEDAGMVGAITVDETGDYNFPYTFEKIKRPEIINTTHSLSFCCTLLSVNLLKRFNFSTLSENKDWFDVFISKQSKKLGFSNYLSKQHEVLHLPHSSRPWKHLKYKNPILYYIKKLITKRDRI